MSACFTFDGYCRATNILIELFSSCRHFCYTVRRSNESDATIVIVPVYVASITKEILPSLSIDERTTNDRTRKQLFTEKNGRFREDPFTLLKISSFRRNPVRRGYYYSPQTTSRVYLTFDLSIVQTCAINEEWVKCVLGIVLKIEAVSKGPTHGRKWVQGLGESGLSSTIRILENSILLDLESKLRTATPLKCIAPQTYTDKHIA